MTDTKKIMVIGGGISGISAAVEASEAGAQVLLVETNPYLGGRVAQMHQYFPKLCPPTCGLEINLRRFRSNGKVKVLTQADVKEVAGEPGNYRVTLSQQPRFVNERCTACGLCTEACPVEIPNSFNLGLDKRKAIHLPFPSAFPARFVIDGKACPGPSCGACVEVCPYHAIDLEMAPKTIEEVVGAIVVATGWSPYDATRLDQLGFGASPNILTNLQMERLAALDGPTRGQILCPSNSTPPKSIAFVQCAGSRDENHLRHCSSVCCMASLKQSRYIRTQIPEAQVYIFYIDIRSPGRLEDFYQACQEDERIHLIKGKVAKVTRNGSADSLTVFAEDVLSGRKIQKTVDLVVLATGMVANLPDLGGSLIGDEHGFLISTDQDSGILPSGSVRRPIDVAESVRDATRAALKAIQSARS